VVPRLILLILSILSLMLLTNNIVAANAYTDNHAVTHNLGFNIGLKVCSPSPSMPFNSLLFNRCEASLEKAASLTMPYKIGFIQGKNDSLLSLHDYFDACKAFPGFVREGTPNWECYLGYADGLSAPVNHAAQQIAIAANEATLAYKTGLKIGRANGKISICDDFSGRSGDICSKAYDDGARSIR
jgi:hypothetical protein